MLAGNGEVPAPVVGLEASPAVLPLWERGPHEYVNTLPRRAYLSEGVEFLDHLPRPALYLSGLRVQTLIQVHAAQIVFGSEDKAYAFVAVILADAYGLLVARPSFRVCALSFLACARVIRYFRRLAIALLDAPAQPLS